MGLGNLLDLRRSQGGAGHQLLNHVLAHATLDLGIEELVQLLDDGLFRNQEIGKRNVREQNLTQTSDASEWQASDYGKDLIHSYPVLISGHMNEETSGQIRHSSLDIKITVK